VPSYNLIEQPFIPCVCHDGSVLEYGLRDVLTRAHELTEIRDASPLVTVALHRLLLAILHRVYEGPAVSAARLAIRNAGAFDSRRIAAYLEKWADRFDLFDEQRPFYQRAGFRIDEASGVNRLAQELTCNNNPMLFDHTANTASLALTPAAAARSVIATQVYAVGGGISRQGNATSAITNFTNGPLVAGAVVLVRGQTVFETLWLNLTTFDGSEKPIAASEDDAPVWERAPNEPHLDPPEPQGYLDYLTWQSRTICLHPEQLGEQNVVRSVSFAQGRRLRSDKGIYDPMMAYARRDKKEPFYPIRFNEFRDLWRESAALFQMITREDGYEFAPTCVRTISGDGLRHQLSPNTKYVVSVSGLCTNSKQAADVLFWRHDTLPLPLAFLDEADTQGVLIEYLKQALKFAESVNSDALRKAVWATASGRLAGDSGMNPDTDRVRALVDSFAPERFYWSRLERPYRELLVDIAVAADRPARIRAWFVDTLRPAAIEAFDNTIGRIDSGRDLKAVTAGRGVLHALLKKIEPDSAYTVPDEVIR
jgi:CRISPR system Cascade subunit CasA